MRMPCDFLNVYTTVCPKAPLWDATAFEFECLAALWESGSWNIPGDCLIVGSKGAEHFPLGFGVVHEFCDA